MSDTKFRLSWRKAFGFLVIASIILGLNAYENWLLRAIAAVLLLVGMVGMFLFFVLSRCFVFIGPRLVKSNLKVRLLVEVICRLCVLWLTIYLAPTLFYMSMDLRDAIERGHPVETEATVTYVPGGAIWNWVWKDVGLETANGETARYGLFFHPGYPEQGRRYEIVVLPKSKCVLSLRPVGQ